MKSLSRDTHPDAEIVQLELLRSAGIAKRLALVLSLSQTVMSMSRAAIARAHPGISDVEVREMFVGLCYGQDLAHRVHKYMEQRSHDRD